MNREAELENDIRNLLAKQDSLAIDVIDEVLETLQRHHYTFDTEDYYDSIHAGGIGEAIQVIKEYANTRYGWNPIIETD